VFSASAEVYDLIYSQFKDYPAEAARLADLIREANPGARRVLDVACGTGEHARLLTETHGYSVDATDLDPAFVRIARGKLPRGTVFEADMITLDLPRRYDVILCLFSAIGYVRTLENVLATLRRMRAHLAPGGVVILEPWFPPGTIESGRVYIKTAESAAMSVCRMSHTEVEGRISRMQFEYLIGSASGIERASESHELGLFTYEEMWECFRAAEFAVTFDPSGLAGRGLYVGRTS
jgi:SAM-dependent methyltransferase